MQAWRITGDFFMLVQLSLCWFSINLSTNSRCPRWSVVGLAFLLLVACNPLVSVMCLDVCHYEDFMYCVCTSGHLFFSVADGSTGSRPAPPPLPSSAHTHTRASSTPFLFSRVIYFISFVCLFACTPLTLNKYP